MFCVHSCPPYGLPSIRSQGYISQCKSGHITSLLKPSKFCPSPKEKPKSFHGLCSPVSPVTLLLWLPLLHPYLLPSSHQHFVQGPDSARATAPVLLLLCVPCFMEPRNGHLPRDLQHYLLIVCGFSLKYKLSESRIPPPLSSTSSHILSPWQYHTVVRWTHDAMCCRWCVVELHTWSTPL